MSERSMDNIHWISADRAPEENTQTEKELVGSSSMNHAFGSYDRTLDELDEMVGEMMRISR